MDVGKILADLRREREAIEEAIITLERLARGQGKRRGRPPAWMAALKRKQAEEGGGERRRGRPPKAAAKPAAE
jgi:hypothetical protein